MSCKGELRSFRTECIDEENREAASKVYSIYTQSQEMLEVLMQYMESYGTWLASKWLADSAAA